MKKGRYLACLLAIVCILSGVILTFINQMTYVRINENQLSAEIDDLKTIFPNGKFKEIKFSDDTGFITKVFEAEGQGYIYKISVKGYHDAITFMLGFNNDGKIVGYEVLYFNDTVGIGDIVKANSFKESIVDKTSTDSIATITGATISSRAVIDGINAARTHYNTMKGITTGDSSTEATPAPPSIELGTPISISDEVLNRYRGEIIDVVIEGNMSTYHVATRGYGLADDDGSHGIEYTRNEYKIVVNTETMTLERIEYIHFGDTKGFGDKTMNEAYYERFEGMSMSDYQQEVDVVSGATMTSRSLLNAIRIVMDDLNK